MEKFGNFKRMEVTGVTKEEALANAPFGIQGDATAALKNAKAKHTGAWTDADTKEFMLNYLAKKTKNVAGSGFYITVESAVVDTRERPYKVEKFKGNGPVKEVKTYQLIDKATGKIVKELMPKLVDKTEKVKDADGNIVKDKDGNEVEQKVLDEKGEAIKVWKAVTAVEAIKAAQNLVAEKHIDVTIKRIKKIVEGTEVIAEVKYTPSKASKPGVYIVFGIESI